MTTIPPNNIESLCRTCLSDSINQKFLFDSTQTSPILKMLQEFTFPLEEHDGFPLNICENCTIELNRAYSFKKLCLDSYNTIRNWLDSRKLKPENGLKSFETKENEPEIKTGAFPGEAPAENRETNKGELANSKSNKKNQWKQYNCRECGEKCSGLGYYWKHMVKIHGKTFKCDLCATDFKSMRQLTKHKASAHQQKEEQERKTKCTKRKTGIIKPRNQPRTCDICNKTFRFHSNLQRHKLIHTGEKPYLCNVCGKGFGQMSYLKIHSFIHTGEKPYKCQMCDKSFAAPGTLMTHIRIHTGERPHICKICGKDFSQSGYLSAHIRTHTGEKPIECKVCHRRFNQSGRLIIHMRIHSGEKPYACNECGRRFAVRGTLKKHIRTHTGERPYICSACGQAFAQSGTLATHMKVHRQKK